MAHSKKHRAAISRGLKAYHKGKGRRKTSKRDYERKYSKSQRRAHAKSRTSKSGHKTWRERKKQKRPGLWANYHAKKAREARR
jgi:hypothetical protein